MSVVNLKSGAITNRDASPVVLSNPALDNARLKVSAGKVAIGTVDSSGSTYRFCQLPSNARVSSLRLFCDAIGTVATPTMDFGLYDTTANGGAAVSSQFFAAAVDIHTSALSNYDLTHSGTPSAIANGEQMVWQQLGLSSDPNKIYDIVGVSGADTDAGGTVLLQLHFVV